MCIKSLPGQLSVLRIKIMTMNKNHTIVEYVDSEIVITKCILHVHLGIKNLSVRNKILTPEELFKEKKYF